MKTNYHFNNENQIMKKQELRKVNFSVRTNHSFRNLTGFFHQWGLTSESSGNDSYYNVTIGICEDEEGNVHGVYPASIQFLD